MRIIKKWMSKKKIMKESKKQKVGISYFFGFFSFASHQCKIIVFNTYLIDNDNDVEYIKKQEFYHWTQAFDVCDVDEPKGLSWKELSDCIVSNVNHLNRSPYFV